MARAQIHLLILVIAGGWALLQTGEVVGQTAPALGSDGSVGAILSVRPTVSQVGDRFMPMVGLGLALRLSTSVELGGEGFLGMRRVRVSSDESPEPSELAMGYGGMTVRYGPAGISGLDGWRAGLVLGAGTARIRSRLADAELDTDNFFVLEPTLEYRRGIGSNLGATVGGGYRLTFGSDPLPGVDPGDIQGITLHLGLSLIRDP